MDLFEKINRAFGSWYEGLFGGGEDVRPKDILRKILTSLEEHRKEGIDGRVYVPNQFVLEIAVGDPEERDYLLSFLDREDLAAAIRRYCQQNRYQVRGALDFTIKEVEFEEEEPRREKVRVRCRYNPHQVVQLSEPNPSMTSAGTEEEATVSRVDFDDDIDATVPGLTAARLEVTTRGKTPYEHGFSRGKLMIGRSSNAGNDVVLDGDGMVSRRHARIEKEADGSFTIYDLDTTNGTRVNGQQIDNRRLSDGDEIVLGDTRLVFRHEPRERNRFAGDRGGLERNAASSAPTTRLSSETPLVPARLVLTDGARDIEDYALASITVIGRALTNDIVLNDRSVGTRHARISRGKPFTLEVLDPEHITLLNGSTVAPGTLLPIRVGDRVGIGTQTLRFEEPEG